MNNTKNIIITICIAIALIIGSIFIYENFIRKSVIDNTEVVTHQLEDKVKNYEAEITNYKTVISIRGRKIDSLVAIKNDLVVQNDSLINTINKTKANRYEESTRVNNVNVNGLYKLFSNYQPR